MGTSKRFLAKNGLDNNSQTLANVADPVNAQDAATKSFASNASNLASGSVPAGRMPALTGDITTTAGTVATSLSTTGVAAGTYPKVTVDTKGRVTAGASLATTDIPNLDAAKITTGTLTVGTSGNAGTATKLQTARSINGVSFDGSADITINAVDSTARIAVSEKGANNGVATLDGTGKVPSTQLPSFVDDVVEYANQAAFPATGTSGVIYVAQDNNKTYRWSGTVYVEISASPGTTDSLVEGTTNLYFTAARAQAAVTSVTGNAGTATKLQTARTITTSGDVTATATSFDGSANITIPTTLSTTGVAAGTYPKVTVDTKGRVTAGASLADTDIPNLDTAKITTGTLAAARMPALTGDITTTAGAVATSLSTTGVAAGTYTKVTVDTKGRVTSAANPTTLAGYGINDAVSSSGNNLPLNQGDLASATLTTSTVTANQVIDSVSATTYRTIKYLIQATSGTAYQATELLVIHDGTTAYLTEYGTIQTGSSLATFDVDISGGNIRLLTTPVNASTTFKVIRASIDV